MIRWRRLRCKSYRAPSGRDGTAMLELLYTAIAVVVVRSFLAPEGKIDFAGGPIAGWPVYGYDDGGSRYSPLTQIGRANVSRLKIAWEYHTGDYSDGSDGSQKTTFQATPILVDGTLYFSTVHGIVIALDPETGTERWRHDSGVPRDVYRGEFASRGVAARICPVPNTP